MGPMLKYSDNISLLACRSCRPTACLCVPCVDVSPSVCSRSTKTERERERGKERLEGAGWQSKRRRRNAKLYPVPRTGAFAQIVCAAFIRRTAHQLGEVCCRRRRCCCPCRATRLQSVCKERGGGLSITAYRTRVSIRDLIMVIKVYIASTSGSISVRATRTAWHALDMSWVHVQHPGLGKAAELFLNSVMSRGWTHQQACCSVFQVFGSRWAPSVCPTLYRVL